MPSLLSRYVSGHVTNGVLGAIAIVVGLDVFIAILSELEKVKGDYTQLEAALHILLQVPRRVNDYLPYCIMIGSLFGLSSLASSSELTVMRAAGLSVWRIMGIALKPVIVFVLLGLVLAEYIAPVTEQFATSRKDVLRYGDAVRSRGEGVWSREGEQFIHFSAIEPGGILYGVDIYAFDEAQTLTEVRRADKAIFRESGHWTLEDVEQSHWQQFHTKAASQLSQDWKTQITPDLLNVIMLKPKRLSLSNLWLYAQFREQQGLDNGRFVLSFWNKALQPLATVALVIVAMTFVFGPMRQTTMGFRLFLGIAAGMAFRMVQNILGPASLIYGFSPALSVLVPSVACFVFAFWMLRRT